jgi:DNA-binding NarL/FixJ family response regulator
MKKKSKTKPSGKIRVMLVDDSAMARDAWKMVLTKSRQIEVVESLPTLDFIRRIKFSIPPEVIVAGQSFLDVGLLKPGILHSLFGYRPKVVLLVQLKSQIPSAFKAGADWVASEPFNDQELINWVRSLSDYAKRLCEEYREQLDSLGSGKKDTPIFYELISDILQLLFHPDLVNPEPGLYPYDLQATRLVFRNQTKDHEFWMDAREKHLAKYVSVDIYNSQMQGDFIPKLGGYLSGTHGMLGLIIAKNMPKPNLFELSVALFENEQKVLLLLTENDILDMLRYKAGGINPACRLQDLYQSLIATRS